MSLRDIYNIGRDLYNFGRDLYKNYQRLLLGVVSLIVLTIAWELVGRSGAINPLFFAWPSTIGQSLRGALYDGELFRHTFATFSELVWGFAAGCLAIPLGIAMARSKTLEYSLDPIVSILYAMPRIALMPLIILILGIGSSSKIFLVFLGCFFPILINVLQGMKNVDPLMIDMARVFGAKRAWLVYQVFVPSIMPYLLAGFRMAVGMGLVMAVVAEFFAGVEGIGYMIANEAGFFNTSAVLAWVMIISVIAVLLTELVKFFENNWIRIGSDLH